MAWEIRTNRRVAITHGLRTPFQKQDTGFAGMTALDLGTRVAAELLARVGLPLRELDQVVFGQVLPSIEAPNIAREIVLAAGFPTTIEAFSVSRACATGYQSIVSGAQAIDAGVADVVLAGGADSSSVVPVTVSRALARALLRASKAKAPLDRLAAFRGLGARDLLPVPPSITEFSTGLTMGQSAEAMAKENGISRRAQDEFAHRSHTLAARAWADGRLREEVMTVFSGADATVVSEDNLVRKDSVLASYEKLRPVFDPKFGTITAATSSPLTDGASAVLLMNEAKAKALGFPPLGFLRSYAFTALDPRKQLLLGPAYAVPLALERAKLSLADMDLVDMHEAFAAQVLSNTQALESERFAREELGRSSKVGSIDWDRFNVGGGSIALGHPFAATGGRQVVQTLRELRRRGGRFALCTACAAGGLGAAFVLEAA